MPTLRLDRRSTRPRTLAVSSRPRRRRVASCLLCARLLLHHHLNPPGGFSQRFWPCAHAWSDSLSLPCPPTPAPPLSPCLARRSIPSPTPTHDMLLLPLVPRFSSLTHTLFVIPFLCMRETPSLSEKCLMSGSWCNVEGGAHAQRRSFCACRAAQQSYDHRSFTKRIF